MNAVTAVEGPLTGRTLEVDQKSGKVIGAKPPKAATGDVVDFPNKKAATKKPDAKKETPVTKTKGGKKVTLVAKKCPARSGTKRAKLWAKLKNGMTMEQVTEAGIPQRFLKKMAKAGHIKIAA